MLCCAVAQAACLALPSLGTHLDRKNAIWASVHLLPHLACRVYGEMLLFMYCINSSQQGINHMAQPGDHLLCMPCLPCFACFVFCECCASQLRKSRGMDASHQCWRFTCSACCSCNSTSHHDDDHACFACFGHHTSQCMVSWTQSVIQLAPLYLLAACSPESCCVLPPLQYVLLPHRDSTEPQEAAHHSLSKVQNAVCRCYMSCDLARLARHIVHGVKTPSPSRN